MVCDDLGATKVQENGGDGGDASEMRRKVIGAWMHHVVHARFRVQREYLTPAS